MKEPTLSIIILNYNTGDYLKNCLDSLSQSIKKDGGYKLEETIVVDNNSQDNSLDLIKNHSLKPKIVRNKKNLGYSAGNNVGVREALKKRPDLVLFLNPDTIVFPETLEKAVQFILSKSDAGIVTCKLELASGQLDEACHRGFPTPWRSFCHFSGLEKLFPKNKIFAGYTLSHLINNQNPHQIDSCSGAFLLIRRELGEKLDWWDEDYYWYGEDLDFCYRVKKTGKSVYFLPKIKITHFRGISSGIKKHSQKVSKAKKETKIKSARASTEAMRIFYKKHYLKKYPQLIGWVILKGINFLEWVRVRKVLFS